MKFLFSDLALYPYENGIQIWFKLVYFIVKSFTLRYNSIPELQRFIQDSPSLLFYGFERFFAHIPPQFVAPLCLTGMSCLLFLNYGNSNRKWLRISKQRSWKHVISGIKATNLRLKIGKEKIVAILPLAKDDLPPLILPSF